MTASPAHKARIPFIEWIRAFAAAAVVLLHVFQTPCTLHPIEELGLGKALAYTELQTALTRWAVPVFLMVTGALLLDPARECPWPKQKKYIVRMLKVLASFGLLFCLLEAHANARAWNGDVVRQAVVNLLSGRSWSHMWYIYALVGVYLALPFLRGFVQRAERRDFERMLAVLWLLTFVVPALNHQMSQSFTTLIWVPQTWLYILLGSYLHRWRRLDARIAAAGAVGLAGALAACAYLVLATGTDYGMRYFDYHSPFIPLYAALVFLAFRRWADRPLPRPVALLATHSFGVYLIHPVFINALYKAYPLALPPVALELSYFLIALLGSLAASVVLRSLPFFRTVL